MTYLDPIRQAASEFAPPPQEPDHPFGDFDKEDPALKPQQASMASPFDAFDKEAPSTEPAPGSLRRTVREFARGPYRAALGLGGAIKDIGPALFQGKEMTSGAQWTHELGLDRPEDATWYEKGADVAGQLLPGMVAGVGISGKVLPTIVQDLAASQVFGPLGEKIGTKLGLAPGRAQALGIGASVLGSGGTATGVNRVIGRVKPPSGDAILDSAQSGYNKVENMPIRWDPNALADNVTNDLAQRMKTSGADITARSAYRMLGALRRTDPQDGAVGLGQVWGVQKELKNLAKQTDAQGHYTPDAHWAGETVKSINQFMENAKDNPSWALSGQQFLPDMSETLAKANQDYSSAMWDDTFGKAYDKAKLSADAVTTAGNLSTNVRREFAKFLDPFHPARSLGLHPDELSQVNQIARGRNVTQNVLRKVGGIAPDSKLGLYAQAAGLGAAMGGNPGGLLLPAVGVAGSLAKRASNRMQKGQIENLRNTVRARSALAHSMHNAAPGSGAGEAGEAAESGLAGVLGEEAPEWVNRAAGAGADTGANAEKDKEAGGGYAMGHRLLKAVGGYDSSFFNQPTIGDQAMSEVALNRASGATPKDILRSVTSPTAQGIGQDVGMAMTAGGGGEFTPQQLRSLISMSERQAGQMEANAIDVRHPPDTRAQYGRSAVELRQAIDRYKSQLPPETPNQAIVRRFKGGGYDDSRMSVSPNVVDRRGYDESKLHWPWTIHANERRFYPQGDPVFTAPILPPPVYTGHLGAAAGINDIPGSAPTVGATGMMNAGGGYDGMTGLLDRMAAPIVAEHSQPWNMGRLANVLGQALGTMGSGPGAPEVAPPLADVISPTQFGAAKANPLLAPQYSTGKSDRLPMGNIPWPQVPGGYTPRIRRPAYAHYPQGGYSVSPMTGGTGF